MRRDINAVPLATGAYLTVFGIGVTLFAAYITHIVWTISLLMATTVPMWNQAILAVIGAFVPPIGVVHGLVIWFS